MHLLTLASLGLAIASVGQSYVMNQTCGGETYTYESLAGFGLVVSDARDKFGDTLGGFGSAIALDRSEWKKQKDGSYKGILFGLPDRGWNTGGTIDYQARIHKFAVSFKPAPGASVTSPSGPNIIFTYLDTILLFGPDGKIETTGLDPDPAGPYLNIKGFPVLPSATVTEDQRGDSVPPTKKISIDGEGLALAPGGGFWISDEYGPYIYRFSETGKLLTAIQPVDAALPMRNGTISFSADSPRYDPAGSPSHAVYPNNNPTGRNNNKGFEGMSLSGDGKTLWVALQSAANQEGGLVAAGRRHIRLFKYDITVPSSPRFAREFVVPLPYANAAKTKIAAQSELFHIQDGTFFMLSRDSGAGNGLPDTESKYRHIDLFNIDQATDVKGRADCATCAIASPAGVLDPAIVAAEYCPFIDLNLNEQLGRFGAHNGGVADRGLLNEKWESIALVPVTDGDDDEWFVLSLSDNDFITQNGFRSFGQKTYQDASGFNLDTQALMFKVKFPKHSRPFPS